MKAKLILHTYILYPKLRAVQYVPNKIWNIPIFPNIPKNEVWVCPRYCSGIFQKNIIFQIFYMYVCLILNLEYSGIFHQKWNIPKYD